MRRGRPQCPDSEEEECEKKQEGDCPPRRKRIQKRRLIKPKLNPGQEEEEQIQAPTIPIQFVAHEQNDHICPICLQFIVKAVSTSCGHSYCQRCLSEFLLFFEECLQCSKPLRSSRCSYNRVLDSMIEALVGTLEEPQKKAFEERCEISKQYATQKKAKTLEVGELVDVRDKDYIWCQARIYRTICRWQQNRTKYIFVQYMGKTKAFNEEICETSERLASHGFYSSRSDIPHYQKRPNGELKLHSHLVFSEGDQQVILNKSPDSDSE